MPPRTLHFGHERVFWECRHDLIPEGDCYESIDLSDKDLYFKLGKEWEFNKHFLFPQEDFNYQQYLSGESFGDVTSFLSLTLGPREARSSGAWQTPRHQRHAVSRVSIKLGSTLCKLLNTQPDVSG